MCKLRLTIILLPFTLVCNYALADPACAPLKRGYAYDTLAEPKNGCKPQAKECPRSIDSVKTEYKLPELAPYSLDHTKTLQQLRSTSAAKNAFSSHHRNLLRAKTVTTLFAKAAIEVSAPKAAGSINNYCGNITSISVGETKTVIFIPTEFKKSTCEYETTLLHETKHYQDAKSALVRMYAGLRGDVLRDLDSGVQIPFAAGSVEEAKQLLTDAVLARVMAQRDWLKDKLEADIADFDTPGRYEYEDNKCPNWPD